jgi:hypothetical protein
MKQQNEKVTHRKYGKVEVLTRTATDRGGLARIETSTQGTFWVRAAEVGPASWARDVIQELRKSVKDLRVGLRRTSQEKRRARIHQRDRAAAELIRRNPKITPKEFCRGMNLRQERKPDCGPPPGWGVQFWTNMLHRDNRNALYAYLHRKKHSRTTPYANAA